MVLNIAFNYGGRDEIVTATKKIAQQVLNNEISITDEKMDRTRRKIVVYKISWF